ncbi:ABC transporter permease subunit [Streptomyces sp. NPDC087425]|uniref:ABC transporter permease subunit n=1 Tax=Streptomyces sp. NPDC087425 TaxID=3365787 RepID=UPI003823E0F9
MIWLTWRQFRTQAMTVAGAVAVFTVLAAVSGPQLNDLYDTAGRNLLHRLTSTDRALYYGGLAIVLLVPAVVGAFWGAPLVARELEAGTHRLAWNQSVTRSRWLLTKFGVIGTATMAVAGLASFAVTWWSGPIDRAVENGGAGANDNFLPRIDPVTFGARGVVPLGYAALAFALGVTLSLLIRRTLAAMAATLAVFTAVQLAMPLLIRPHLAPSTAITVPFTADTLANYGIDSVSHVDIDKPGAWITSEQTLDASGHTATGMPSAYTHCDSLKAYISALAKAGYHQRVTYQPAGNFWSLQWTETSIYAGLAAVLGLFCIWWIRRRAT